MFSADHVALSLQFMGEAAALCSQVRITALQFQSVTCVPHPTPGIHLLVKRELVNVCLQVLGNGALEFVQVKCMASHLKRWHKYCNYIVSLFLNLAEFFPNLPALK